VMLTPYPLLVPRSKKQGRAIPPLSLRAFVACKKGETNLPNSGSLVGSPNTSNPLSLKWQYNTKVTCNTPERTFP
jgi:hypothetical protein